MNIRISRRRLFTLLGACSVASVAAGAEAETGTAVYYSDYFEGRPAANGEIYSKDKLTAAHNGLRYGTKVKVTNLSNDKSVEVVINDRMRSTSKVLIDLSRRAAEELDFVTEGKTQVRLEVVE
jgi:rare lipoprotein A